MHRAGLATVVLASLVLALPSAAHGAADLSVTATESADPVGQGKTVTYTVTVTNSGPDAATNALVEFGTGSPTLSFNSATAGGGWSVSLVANTIRYQIGSFPAGATATHFYTGATAREGVASLPLAVSSGTADDNQANNSAPQTTTVTGLVVTPVAPLAFGSQPVGLLTAPQLVTVTNTTSSTQTVGRPGTSGAHAADFLITRDRCEGASLAANATCTLDLLFEPHAAGARSGVLDVPENSAFIDSPAVPLTGTGTDAPQGPVGPQGPAGSDGAEGLQGPQGPQGPAGATVTRLVLVPFTSRLNARVGSRVRLRYVATDRSRVRMDVFRGTKRVARVTGRSRLGRNALVWNGRIGKKAAPPGRYRLRLRGVAGERVATASARLRLRR